MWGDLPSKDIYSNTGKFFYYNLLEDKMIQDSGDYAVLLKFIYKKNFKDPSVWF